MPNINEIESNIEKIIDDLKGLIQTVGQSNQGYEEELITSVFLYKFLNDKFMVNLKEFSEKVNMSADEILVENKNGIRDVFYKTYPNDVAFRYEETIEYLVNQVSKDNFYKIFDDTLENISLNPLNESFGIETADGGKEPLFKRLIDRPDIDNKDNFAKSIIGIISQRRFDFGEAFKSNFDFYSRIFEYLIKDYNVASGTYAEYFTPQVISKIIAKILVHMSPVEDISYDIYDPSAGSGSLILHLANELGEGSFGNKAQVFTQDISAKSSRFLRINMLLNGLTDSLDNIIRGDTLVSPAHYVVEDEPISGIKQFDFITSNPPFKMDFSATRDTIENKWAESDEHDGVKRFFAGIPKIPNKKKDSMGIYLCFAQHIIWSLKENGKAAIVVPTGFLTANTKIEKNIRKILIDNKWLKGAISMPPNIFANTGTNVSVIFIDKSSSHEKVMLIDASDLGEKYKEGKNQKTILTPEDVQKIEQTFINNEIVDEFSVKVSFEEIQEKKYSFSAPQYFDIKIIYSEISEEEYNEIIEKFSKNFNFIFEESHKLDKKINDSWKEIKFATRKF